MAATAHQRERVIAVMPILTYHPFWTAIRRCWRHRHWPDRRLLLALLILAIVYGLSPYVMLWSLNRALVEHDQARLALLVDLDTVREELGHRLNKEEPSAIDHFSDAFIEWLEVGIREHGVNALNQTVTLNWVSAQLTARTAGDSFWFALPDGFFESPRYFRLRIGHQPMADPLVLRLRLGIHGWRVVTLYE